MMWKPFKKSKKREQHQSDTPDWVVEKRRLAKALANEFSFEAAEGEPLPPWIQYPEILIGSIGWRMGAGEDFLHEVFFPYWQNLNQSQQAAYFQKFDLGSKWEDRSQWLESLERNSGP
ncbi:MAG: hypothetical protein AAF231_13525 [Pseudomonadota bacterium]